MFYLNRIRFVLQIRITQTLVRRTRIGDRLKIADADNS